MKNKLLHRALALFMVLSLCLSMVPVTFAADAMTTYFVANAASGGSDLNGSGTEDSPYLTISKAVERANADGLSEISIILLSDFTSTKEIKFDDSGSVKTFHISGRNGTEKIYYTGTSIGTESGFLNIGSGATVNFRNITLTGSNNSFSARVMYVTGNANLDNVIVNGSRLNQVNAVKGGAGIMVADGGSVSMENTTISGNKSAGAGGGAIFVADGGALSIGSNTTIQNNEAKLAAGIYAEMQTKSYGGTVISGENIHITGNKNDSGLGAGIYVEKGANVRVAGSVHITGNTIGSAENNVYLADEATIDISGATTSASIGISANPAETYRLVSLPRDYTISETRNGDEKGWHDDLNEWDIRYMNYRGVPGLYLYHKTVSVSITDYTTYTGISGVDINGENVDFMQDTLAAVTRTEDTLTISDIMPQLSGEDVRYAFTVDPAVYRIPMEDYITVTCGDAPVAFSYSPDFENGTAVLTISHDVIDTLTGDILIDISADKYYDLTLRMDGPLYAMSTDKTGISDDALAIAGSKNASTAKYTVTKNGYPVAHVTIDLYDEGGVYFGTAETGADGIANFSSLDKVKSYYPVVKYETTYRVIPRDTMTLYLSTLHGQTLNNVYTQDSLDMATIRYTLAGDETTGTATVFGVADDGKLTFRIDQVRETVYFKGNEGDATTAPAMLSEDSKLMPKSASTYGTLATAELTGYTFAGWYTDPEEGTQVTSATAYETGVSPVILYAHWIANDDTAYQVQHWVEYDQTGFNLGYVTGTETKDEGGVTYYLYQTDDYSDGTSDTIRDITDLGLAPEDMTDATLTWWTLDGFTPSFEQNCKVLADGSSVFSVYYARNAYEISFIPGGAGTITSTEQLDPIHVRFGSRVGAMPRATLAGYSFAGWYNEDSQRITATTVYNKVGDTVVTAKWNPQDGTAYAIRVMVQDLQKDSEGKSSGSDSYVYYKTVYQDEDGNELQAKTDSWTSFALGDVGAALTTDMSGFDFAGYGASAETPYNSDGNNVSVYVLPASEPVSSGESFNERFDGSIVYLFYDRKTSTVKTVDGQGNGHDADEIVYGGDFTGILPTAPGRDGYDFDGWVDPNGKPVTEKTYADDYVKDGGELILRSTWTARTYRLTYVPGAGSTFVASDGSAGVKSPLVSGGYFDAAEITYDQKLGTMPLAAKRGYSFDGWFLEDGTQITPNTVASVNNVVIHRDDYTHENTRVLYAHYTPHTYTLDLDAGSSKYSVPGTVSPASVNVTYDSEVTGLPTPKLTGYTFVAWMIDPNDPDSSVLNGDTWTRALGSDGDHVTLHAAYIPSTYTYTFDLNDSAGSTRAILVDTTVRQSEETYDTAYDGIFEVEAHRAGYDFQGWSLTPAGSPLAASDLVKLARNATVYAVWAPHIHTITFAMNGATMDLSDNEGDNFAFYQADSVYDEEKDTWTVPIQFDDYYGTVLERVRGTADGKLPYPSNETSRRFLGWKVTAPNWSAIHESTLTPDESDGFPRLPRYVDFADRGIMLSAVMDPKIIFVYDDGHTEDFWKSEIEELPEDKKEGYDFEGWTTEDGADILTLEDVLNLEDPTSLIPVFSAKVTFDANSGSFGNGEDSMVCTLSSLQSLPTVTRSGYTFRGWYTEKKDGEKVTLEELKTANQPATVYAQWTVTRPSYTGGGGYTTPTTYTIQVTKSDKVDTGYTGNITVTRGRDVTITFRPEDGYRITGILIDGDDVGVVDSYTFEKVNANHTIEVLGVDLLSGDHIRFIKGYEDGSFGPEKNITRAETAMMFYRLLTNDAVNLAASRAGEVPYYDDTPKTAWYIDAVMVLTALDIVEGRGNQMFAPDAPITRAEFATIASRFAELEEGTSSFKDVDEGHWAYRYIVSAAEKGWVNGYPDGTFRPNEYITRAEAVSLVDRATGRIPDQSYITKNLKALKTFTDVTNPDNWAFFYIMEAANSHDYSRDSDSETWTGLR